tara:strand:- start:15 stop:1484 length:1470 start_codon:yes stop_codon:yes gene_type:complete
MAALGLTQLKQRDGRIDTLIRLFSEGHSFIMEKGADGKTTSKKFKISGIILRTASGNDTEIIKSAVNTKSKRAAAVKKISRFTGKLIYNGFYGSEKQEYEIIASYMSKSTEFGGSSGKVGQSGKVSASAMNRPTGSETLGVRAETLILGGKLEKVRYGTQDVECRTFTSADKIAASMVKGLEDNSKIPDYITEDFKKYQKSKKWNRFEWNESIPKNEMNQLGKYAGEVITGLIGMSNYASTAFHSNILSGKGKVETFCVPTDPAFSGVDVFFCMKDGSIIPVSNKYGKGAAASFFTNLMPEAMSVPLKTLSNSPLKDIVKIANVLSSVSLMKKGGAQGKAKPIIYEYGIRKILGFSKTQIKNPYTDVYEPLRQEKATPITRKVVSAIEKYAGADGVVIKNLPKSVTAFFCREIAKEFNASKGANEDMAKILAGKNYWQANLNDRKWAQGDVDYKMTNSGKVKINVIGSKAPTTDIVASQGLVNYFMETP